MTAVILNVLLTVAAFRHWNPHLIAIEDLGIALSEIEQRVVGGIQFSPSWKRAFHRHSYPVAEFHFPPLQMSRQVERPLRHVVNEHRSARLDDSNGFVNPLEAPLQVVLRHPCPCRPRNLWQD